MAKRIHIIRFDQLQVPPGVGHVSINYYQPGRRFREHRHDFCELYWVQSGQMIDCADGDDLNVDAGQLLLLFDPTLSHSLRAPATGPGAVMVNVAMAVSQLKAMVQQDRSLQPLLLPATDKRRRRFKPAEPMRYAMDHWAQQVIFAGICTQTDLQWLLWTIARVAHRDIAGTAVPPGLPHWLAEALQQFQQPEYLTLGMTGLIQLTGRTREHIARTLRKTTGKKASDWIAELRLKHAAAELRFTDRAIMDICLSSGYSNLSYFYRLFDRYYQTTPRQYRLQYRRAASPDSYS